MEKRRKIRLVGSLMAAIMVMLMLAACDSGASTVATPVPPTPTVPVAQPQSNADLLKAAAENMKGLKSYRLVVNANQAGQEIKLSGDIDAVSNNAKLDMSAAGQSIKMIAFGGETYVSMDGGTTYTKSGSSTTGIESFTEIWNSFKAEEIDKAKDALKDGTPKDETIGSDQTRHMTASTSDLASLSAGGGATEGTVDMWVTTGAKPTVRKMKMVGTSNGQPFEAEIEWSNIDQAVTIEAPPTTP